VCGYALNNFLPVATTSSHQATSCRDIRFRWMMPQKCSKSHIIIYAVIFRSQLDDEAGCPHSPSLELSNSTAGQGHFGLSQKATAAPIYQFPGSRAQFPTSHFPVPSSPVSSIINKASARNSCESTSTDDCVLRARPSGGGGAGAAAGPGSGSRGLFLLSECPYFNLDTS